MFGHGHHDPCRDAAKEEGIDLDQAEKCPHDGLSDPRRPSLVIHHDQTRHQLAKGLAPEPFADGKIAQ
jgi:hypothetical protein